MVILLIEYINVSHFLVRNDDADDGAIARIKAFGQINQPIHSLSAI